jgi:hypothetical protein
MPLRLHQMLLAILLSVLIYFVFALFFRERIEAQESSEITDYSKLPWISPDRSEELHSITPDHSATLSEKYEVLLVPGFFHEWFRGYMDSFRQWLKTESFAFSTAATRSECASSENVLVIRKALQAAQKKVLIIAHSRGGVEVLEALVAFPELRSKVAGVWFIQSPFYGTWVADLFSQRLDQNGRDSWDRFLSSTHLLPLALRDRLQGIWQSTKALQAAKRQDWMLRHQQAIHQTFVEDQVPALTLTSHDARFLQLTSFELFRKLMHRRGILSDGVVPERSMQIPGVTRVSFENINHADFVFLKSASHHRRFSALCSRLLILSTGRFSERTFLSFPTDR